MAAGLGLGALGGGISLPTLVQRIKIDESGVTEGAGAAETRLRAFGAATGKAGVALTKGVTLPLAAAGAAGLKMATDVDSGLREVITLTGQTGAAAEKELGVLKDSVEGLSGEIGIAQTELVDGLYQALSAGVPRENVFEFLKVAGKAGIAGVTDTKTAIDGITTTINAFGLDAADAERVADSMFTTVKGGKTTFGELSDALFNVAPSAAAAKVDFTEVNAAIAALTAQGVPTSVATTQIRSALVGLQKPSADLTKVFNDAGYESGQMAIEALGLAGALGIVTDAAGGDNAVLQTLLGRIEAVQAAQVITTTGAEKFADEMENQADAAGAMGDAFDVIDAGPGRRFQRLWVDLQASLISIGETLLPIAQDIVDFVSRVLDAFSSLPSGAQTAALGIAFALGPGLIVVSKMTTAVLSLHRAFQLASRSGAVARVVSSLASLGALGPAGIGVAAVAGLAAAVVILRRRIDPLRKSIEGMTDAFVDQTGKIDLTVESMEAYLDTTSRFDTRNQKDDLDRLGLTYEQLTDLIRGGAEGLETYLDLAVEHGEVTDDQAAAIRALGGDWQGYLDGLVEAETITASQAGELRSLNVDAGLTAETFQRLQNKSEILNGSNTDLVKSFLVERDALQEVAEASVDTLVRMGEISDEQRDTAIALATGADGLTDWALAAEIATGSAEANAMAADDAGDSAAEFAAEAEAAGDAAAETVDPLGDSSDALDENAEAAAAAKEKYDALIQTYRDWIGEVTGGASNEIRQAQRLADLRDEATELRSEGLEPNTDAYRDLQLRLLDVLGAEADLAFESGQSLGPAMHRVRERGDELNEMFPELSGFIDETITKMSEVPEDIRVDLDDSDFREGATALAVDAGSLGVSIGDALEGGVEVGFGSVADGIGSAMRRALDQARAEAGIQSPSTVWRDEVGKPIGQGVAAGFSTAIGTVIPDTVGDALAGVDVSSILSKIGAAEAALEAARDAADEAGDDFVSSLDILGGALSDLDMLRDLGVLSADEYLAHLRAHLDGYEAWSLEWIEIAQRVQTEEQAALDKQREQREEAIEAHRDYVDDVRATVGDARSIVADAAGDDELTIDSFIKGLRDQARDAFLFKQDIAKLRKTGLPDELVNEIFEAGPGRAGDLARVLADAGRGDLKTIQDVLAKLDFLGGSLAAMNKAFFGLPAFDTGGEFRTARPGGRGLAILDDGERVLRPDLDRQLASISAALAESMSGETTMVGPTVRVYIGDRELRDMIHVEIDEHDDDLADDLAAGRRP